MLNKSTKRKLTAKPSTVDGPADCDRSEHSDSEDQELGPSKKRHTLSDSSNAPPVPSLSAPLGIPKNYDAKAALSKKFKVPYLAGAAPAPTDNFALRRTLGMRRRNPARSAVYDADAEDAITLWSPEEDEGETEEKPNDEEPQQQKRSRHKIGGGESR